MNNKFKVNSALKPYIRIIMAKQEIRFRFRTVDGQLYIYTDISGTRFHKIVQRAKCMLLTEQTGILHVTKRESEDNEFVMSLQQEHKVTSYVVAGKNKDN